MMSGCVTDYVQVWFLILSFFVLAVYTLFSCMHVYYLDCGGRQVSSSAGLQSLQLVLTRCR
jgi:hypothetical protein